MIADWATTGDARFVGRAQYRDYSRIVLSRMSPYGELRLFVDSKTGFPVKLDLEEKHYLWGQRRIEYLYANWTLSGGIRSPVPASGSRMARRRFRRHSGTLR